MILGYFPVQRQWAYRLVCQLRRSNKRGRRRHLGDGQRGGTRELKQVSRHLGLVPTGVLSIPWQYRDGVVGGKPRKIIRSSRTQKKFSPPDHDAVAAVEVINYDNSE